MDFRDAKIHKLVGIRKRKVSTMFLRISDHNVEGIMNECVRTERKKREYNAFNTRHDQLRSRKSLRANYWILPNKRFW